jgi:hypothetical protein
MSYYYYKPQKSRLGEWGYETPTGKICGITTRESAERLAKGHESKDRQEAAAGQGPNAATLKAHFEKEDLTKKTPL